MAIERIEQLFEMLVKREGSDLHLKQGSYPMLRINGELTALKTERMTPDLINKMIHSILSDKQKKEFSDKKILDFSFGLPDVARFRINYSMQRGTPRIVVRRVPYEIKKLENLNLPYEVLKDFCSKESGLVLVTGPTGCGKSTTLAGMIDYINNTRNCHIVTVEDPIEFLYKDYKAMITQQEVKIDIESFPVALENILRQDPDVMVVGEMRSFEAMQTVLNASETGHLVLSTLHTTSAPSSITRMIASFPTDYQNQVRIQLASSFLGILTQKLVPSKEYGRLPVTEILVMTPYIQNMILNNAPESDIHQQIIKGKDHYGMRTMNMSLVELFNEGKITKEVALNASPNKDEFERNLKGNYLGTGTC